MKKRKQNIEEVGISYVCKYRLCSMYKRLIRNQMLDSFEKIASEYNEAHSIEGWHTKFGLYKSWKKKPH